MLFWQTETCVQQHVMWTRWRQTSTNTWLAPLGFPPPSKIIQVRLSHSGVSESPAALGWLFRFPNKGTVDLRSTVRADPLLLVIHLKVSVFLQFQCKKQTTEAPRYHWEQLQNMQRELPHQPDKYSCSSVKLKYCRNLASTNGAADA